MLKLNSTAASLMVATLAAGAVALAVEHYRVLRLSERAATQRIVGEVRAAPAAKAVWTASAPGRVEPNGGDVRIGAQIPARVVRVMVRMNDTVKAGDLLAQLADDEARAKLSGVLAEVGVRKRERDDDQPAARRRTPEASNLARLVTERNQSADAVYEAQRALSAAQAALDGLQYKARSGGNVSSEQISSVRTALASARDTLTSKQDNLSRVERLADMPLPTRLESGLAAARSELTALEAAIERSRVRAPADGTVLRVNTHVGETVTPSPEDVMFVFGDLTRLRVRAEVEERDVGKIRVGQSVTVRSDAFPDQEFTGKVERMAQALGAPRLAGRGPRRPMEQEVLQVLIDLEGRPPLLPGMRIDVFFKPDATVSRALDGRPRAN